MSITITQIGRYHVEKKIGSGGMATTYRCWLKGIGGFQKRVLIKQLQEEHGDKENFRQMFLDEARLCARLEHPNLPQIFEVGEVEGRPHIVMEYIAGPELTTLYRRIKRGEEPRYGELALIMKGVCQGLDHAHNQTNDDGSSLKIIHRGRPV